MNRTALATAIVLVLAGALAAPAGAAARCRQTPAAPELQPAYVEGIQRQLLELGFNPGRNDGQLGGRTDAAIRAYQRRAGLPVDGCASKELLDHMSFVQPRVTATAAAAATVNPGAAPGLVQEAQQALTEKGYYLGPVDGRSGPKTRAAVLAFQRDRGLAQTGSIDSDLIRALKAPR
jgi:peptidoglycan hydrolase-like protein with peptidoglycan-binding domain